MLVLSRERDETIMIGDDIEITIVDIRGDKIRIGINAPSKVAVHRKEVYDAIRAENAQASRLGDEELTGIAAAIEPGPTRQKLRGLRIGGAAVGAAGGVAVAGGLTPVRVAAGMGVGATTARSGVPPAGIGKRFAGEGERRGRGR